jgi:hypothetical protein
MLRHDREVLAQLSLAHEAVVWVFRMIAGLWVLAALASLAVGLPDAAVFSVVSALACAVASLMVRDA